MNPNLNCDTCHETATVFAIQEKDKIKIKACDIHLPELRKKELANYDIGGFYFINSPQDFVKLEARKAKRVIGMAKLDVLQGFYDELLRKMTEAAANDRNVDSAYIGWRLKLRLQEITKCLQVYRSNLNNWILQRSSKRERAAKKLTSDLEWDYPALRVAMTDSLTNIGEVIINGFTNRSIPRLEIEALMANAYQEFLTTDNKIENSKKDLKLNGLEKAEYFVRVGEKLKKLREYLLAEKSYEDAIRIYRLCNSIQDIARCLFNLGSLLRYLGRFREVEERYLEALQIVELTSQN